MFRSDLLESDVFIAGLLGQVDTKPGYRVVRTPNNPNSYFGNLLVLDEVPIEIGRWLKAFEREFRSDPAIRHCCIAWPGTGLDEASKREADSLELEGDLLVELQMRSLAPRAQRNGRGWTVQRLRHDKDWPAIRALDSVCKRPDAEGGEEEAHRAFSKCALAARHVWLSKGLATWWGVFDGERLVGQCGMILCGNIGRFQDVETHPEYRRQGICSALIRAVAADALARPQVSHVVLAAEVDGPALGLYRRLGFLETGRSHSLVRHSSKLHIRGERPADHAAVRSMVRAAFNSSEKAQLVEELRVQRNLWSLVAIRSGRVLGHLMLSTVALPGTPTGFKVASIVSLAVRPEAQRRGVAAELVEAGLVRCQTAGYCLCIVAGYPEYYRRFGFVLAGAHCAGATVATGGEPLQVKQLKPGALGQWLAAGLDPGG